MEERLTELRLLTVHEVADILRLNKQVILRKLKAGEIEAYKIGKEWRVAEKALRSWLESHSNQAEEPDRAIRSFFDSQGRLKQIPARKGKRFLILKRLLEEFELDRVYSEKEVNAILGRFHEDVCTLRREMVCEKLMVRKDGRYRRCSAPPGGPNAPLPSKGRRAAEERLQELQQA